MHIYQAVEFQFFAREPVLGLVKYFVNFRVFVLCSQSQAQMWRRNGFSLVNQVVITFFCFRSVNSSFINFSSLFKRLCCAFLLRLSFISAFRHSFK